MKIRKQQEINGCHNRLRSVGNAQKKTFGHTGNKDYYFKKAAMEAAICTGT